MRRLRRTFLCVLCNDMLPRRVHVDSPLRCEREWHALCVQIFRQATVSDKPLIPGQKAPASADDSKVTDEALKGKLKAALDALNAAQ